MAGRERKSGQSAASWRAVRDRLRLECRECEVICERVVSPWRCLKDSCPFVYVYEDRETSYFGCLHKVFSPELDLAPFRDIAHRKGRTADPYGSLRVTRSPRAQCLVRVEQAYTTSAESGCCNPTFFLHPSGTEDTIRLTTNIPVGEPGGAAHPDVGDSSVEPGPGRET